MDDNQLSKQRASSLSLDVENQSGKEYETVKTQDQNGNTSETTETGKTLQDPNIVDWDGPDDPRNPLNWPAMKKVAAIGMVSLITMLSPLASTIISPATAEVMQTFHSTNETLGAFITSVYLIGYTFGPLVLAPLSEMYGRAPLYNICNVIFVIFNVACALAPNLGGLIVFRLLTGIAASCPMTLGAGSIADVVLPEKRGLAMTGYIAGPLLGPTFGPLAGGYLAEAKGWRWIFWVLSIVGGGIAILTLIFMQESYAYVLLERKAKRLRKETGNPNIRSVMDSGKKPKQLFAFSIVRPIKMLLFSPIVFLLSLYTAIIYGYLYLLFTTFPRVFQGQYGFSNGNIGLTYLGTGIGSFFGLVYCGVVSDRWVKILAKRNNGVAIPEYRLPVMLVGGFLIAIGLFMYGWTAEKKVHWIAPIIGTALLGAGMFVNMMPSMIYLVDAFTVHAASATAAATVFRSLLGALLPLAGNKMYDALGVGWGTSVLGFIAVLFIPVPFIFYKYGQRIRESKLFRVNF